jgi:hypothetical protein
LSKTNGLLISKGDQLSLKHLAMPTFACSVPRIYGWTSRATIPEKADKFAIGGIYGGTF